MATNARRVGFPVCHFVRNYIHNSKTKGHTRTFCLSNDCSTIEDILLVRSVCEIPSASYGYKHTSKPICNTSFCAYTLVARKLLIVCRHSTYGMTALLSQMCIFCVGAGFEIQMGSYASKHASKSLSDKPFLRIPCS